MSLRIARVGIALLGLLALGCRGPEGPRYHVAHRLIDAIPLRPPPVHCVLSDDRRPAIGCPPRSLLRRLEDRALEANDAIPLSPMPNGGGALVFATVEWTDKKPRVEDLPPVVMGPLPRQPSIRLSQLGISDPSSARAVYVWARELTPPMVSTNLVAVAPGAVLSVAIAIDPIYRGASVDAVDFTITARIGARQHEVFHEVLDANDPAAATWHERRVPLDALGPAPVRFEFITRVVPRADVSRAAISAVPGVDVASVTALPLWGAPEILEPVGPEEPPNVLLVSLDTMRADHLGTYGSRLATSPHLDALAEEAVVFERAIAPFPSTTASHMSMLTGLYPARHGVRGPMNPLAPGTPTLAKLLAARGWRTAAVTEDGMVAPNVGFPIGFSEYRENREAARVNIMRGVEATFTTAIDWLERHSRERFFLFVHTYEVHFPYMPPPEFDVFRTWQDGDRTRPIAEAPWFEQARHAYAGEVGYADAQVARLLDALDRLGVADRTLVVVTADHGEEFGDHGRWNHGHSLYDELLHVPLIMRAPGRLPAGRRIATPVSLVDLVPTILDLVGVAIPSHLDGESQLARMRGGAEDPDRMVFAETENAPPDPRGRMIAARTATRKWIFAEKPARVIEAYDLAADPGEHAAITGDDIEARGLVAVAPYRDRIAGVVPADVPAVAPLDDQLKSNLRALGYAN